MCYRRVLNHDRSGEKRMRTLFVIASILGVVFLLLPVGIQAVWDGKFDLTIVITQNQPIDQSSLLFATCWQEVDATHAVENPGFADYGFRAPKTSATGKFVIEVPCSGRCNFYGCVATYDHPKFLVAEYRLADNPDLPVRKCFEIPDGRGARTICIVLP